MNEKDEAESADTRGTGLNWPVAGALNSDSLQVQQY